MSKVKAIKSFYDLEAEVDRETDETWECSKARSNALVKAGVAEDITPKRETAKKVEDEG